jgi:hypothetical protein
MSSRDERIALNEAVFREINERIEESVVARLKGYDIVRKNRGVPEQIAEQTDPRDS